MGEPRVVVVTGAGGGIGLALCVTLAARGYAVVATVRRPESAPDALSAAGCRVEPLDVTDAAAVASFVGWLRAEFGRCECVVTNAGFGVPGNVEEVSVEAGMSLFDVNVWGVVRVLQGVLPIMKAGGGGLIVHVSSTAGVRGLGSMDMYCASKAAVEGLLESARYTLAAENVAVCLVNPGPVQTRFLERFAKEGEKLRRADKSANADAAPNPREEAAGTAAEPAALPVRNLAARMGGGQTAEECAASIADVIDRECGKRVDGSSPPDVRFWNGTSPTAERIVSDVKRYPDGNSGPVYEACWSLVGRATLATLEADK